MNIFKFFKAVKKMENIDGDELEKAIFDSDSADTADEIAQAYYGLIKSKCGKNKTWEIVLDKEDTRLVRVNGKIFDFDCLVSHNDMVNTERLMMIDALMADEPDLDFGIVQEKLNEKFRT